MAWFQKKTSGPVKTSKTAPARAAKGLRISSLLSEDVILFAHAGQDKATILQTLTAAVCRKAGEVDCPAILAKIQEREQGISTTLDTGLSLPHARVDGISGIFAGMSILKMPIPDPKQADLMIRVIFLFIAPNKREIFPVHLQLLRGISSLFQPALIDRLAAASGAAEVLELIRKIEG